jgi:translation initiation factor 5
MHLQVAGDKILGKCDSCPFVGELDNKHKLATFIIKNPPIARSMATGKVVKVETEKQQLSTQITKDKKSEEKTDVKH